MREKLRLLRYYFEYILPKQWNAVKSNWKQYRQRGHIYFKPFYYNPSINVGYITIHKVLSTSLCRMMLDMENIFYKKYDEHNVHHQKFFVNSAPPPLKNEVFFFLCTEPICKDSICV